MTCVWPGCEQEARYSLVCRGSFLDGRRSLLLPGARLCGRHRSWIVGLPVSLEVEERRPAALH